MLGSGKEIQNNGASLCALHISLLCNFITTVVKGSLSCFNGKAHNGLALRFSNKQTFVLVLLDSQLTITLPVTQVMLLVSPCTLCRVQHRDFTQQSFITSCRYKKKFMKNILQGHCVSNFKSNEGCNSLDNCQHTIKANKLMFF